MVLLAIGKGLVYIYPARKPTSTAKKYLIMVRKNLFLLCLLYLPFIPVFSQTMNVDSMRQVIRTTADDSVRGYTMTKLANYFLNHSSQTAEGLSLLDSAKQMAVQHKYHHISLQANNVRGNYYTKNNEWDKAIEIFKRSLNEVYLLTDSAQRMKARMMLLSNVGNNYMLMGDFSTSLDYHLQSLAIVEKMKPVNYNNLATVYINVINDYSSLNLDSKSVEYFENLNKIGDSINIVLRINQLSLEYDFYYKQKDENKIKSIIATLKNALDKKDFSQLQLSDGLYVLNYMQGDYADMFSKDYATAISYYKSSLAYAGELEDDRKKVYVYYKLGNTYAHLNQLSEAILNLEKGLALSNDRDLADQKMNILSLLGEVNYQSKNYKKAADYYVLARSLSDSIYNDKKTKELNYLEAKYQNRKKENEITSLQLANTKNELAIVKRNRLLFIGGGTAAAFFVILGLYSRNNRQKRIIAEKDKSLQQEQIKFLERQQQVVSLQSMVNGQETERTRISRDLHDGLGGLFSTIKMQLSTLQHEEKELKENELFQKSYKLIDTASVEVRRIAHNMMPEVLMKLGLIHAVQDMCSNISATKLLQVTLQAYGTQQRFNTSTEIMLYRIIQELLNNIIKHAKATEAIVQFNREGSRLSVTVEDNGKGFNLAEVDGENHAGLDTIKSRVDYLNGNISIDSEKGTGTTVMMEFLINEEG